MSELSVVIAGASGFLGSNLREELERRGHRVVSLVRRPAASDNESTWDPYAGELDRSLVRTADVVVNLAGSPNLGNPHSRRWAERHRESRVATTRLLAETIAGASTPPAFLAGNAVGWYGDHGADELTEDADSAGQSLLTQTCREWQAATLPAAEAGARVCVLRTAPVMDRSAPPLPQLRLLFSLGLGGRLGSGDQYMPMISLRDWVGAVAFLAEHPSASGPVNLCCEPTPTNREFTRALAELLHRPAVLPVPAPVLRVVAGPVAPEILGSVRTVPAALREAGYELRDPSVEDVLATGLAGTS
ncbi:TIGR01777 family protein [Nocardioides sp. GY 10113]|uniref:TIGR01777 family oxidoreductase n=1 Tax=Nocardioides sp. GY 10113 TaxID=2569761 RepID=UPI0010A822E6|nr:TIGR01777 family oxidoreductase [Nocardioides sp. GY 10113]TIC79880.1 TIGR01777 family protein [Nocardioides sp. GY 10113]